MSIYIPQPTKEECEIIALLVKDDKWRTVDQYLSRSLQHIADELGKVDNTREEDMSLKGLKAGFDHLRMLPVKATEILKPPKEEEENVLEP